MKKIVSILLVLTVLVNFVGFGVFNVRASAVAPLLAAIIEIIKDAIIGAGATAVGTAAGAGIVNLSHSTNDFNTQYFIQQSTSDVTNGNLVQVTVDGSNHMIFSVSSNCSSESLEYAQRLVNRLNSLPDEQRWVDPDGLNARINASTYAAIKSAVDDEYFQYLSAKGAIDVGEAGAASGELPTYSFDFTGPVPGVMIPTSTGYTSLTTADGAYTLSVPVMLDRDDGRFVSGNLDSMFGCSYEWSSGSDSRGYKYQWSFDENKGAYGYGSYIVYNGKIYYMPMGAMQSSHISSSFYSTDMWALFQVSRGMFVSSDGENLADAFDNDGRSSIAGLQAGVYFVNSPDATFRPEQRISESDMTTTTGGGTIEIPRTDAENAIGAAIAAGIISDDPELTLDENGNITAADGIDLSTIEDLLRGLASDDVDLSSIEGYLASIRTLLANGNTKTDDIKRILSSVQSNIKDITALKTAVNGIKALEQSQANSLANIESQIAAINEALTASQAITADTKFDIDTPDTIIDKFPFSLPFDVYNTFNLLSAQPVAPKFTFPVKMEGLFDYSITVDLSEYEWIAEIVRWLLFVVFVIGLILATNKLIGRG